MVWVVLTRSRSGNSSRLVAVTLALLAERDGTGAVPTATLLAMTRCSERTVRDALGELCRLGELEAATTNGRVTYRWLLAADSAEGGGAR